MSGKQAIIFALPCPYCGKHEFTICPSILTGQIPAEIAHLVFKSVMCEVCQATFAEAVMIDPTRNAQQRHLYASANRQYAGAVA